MDENKTSTPKRKKIKVKNSNLKKWRCLFIALMRSPCAQRRMGKTSQKNVPQSPIAKDITPWDDDESEIFSN